MESKMKRFMCSMLADVDGHVSSKRFITLMAFFCVMIAFLVNVFMSIPLEEFVFDGMMYLVAAGLGFSTVEKFSRSKSSLSDESTE
jgi:FtsH-binding integral membrane protein